MADVRAIVTRWRSLSTDEIRSEIDELVASHASDAAQLLLWLTLDHQVQAVGLDVERRQANEAITDAHRHRRLWQVAADCLRHNAARLAKPRGVDERLMLSHAATAHGPAGGKTDGWLDWLAVEAPEDQQTVPASIDEPATVDGQLSLLGAS